MRMLFDYHDTDRLLVCLDPANIDLLQDFYSDRSVTKLLEIECDFSDEYLLGHAKRVGLAGEQTPQETLDQLLPTIRYDVVFESDRIRDANFANHYRLRESASVEENTVALAEFLSIQEDQARELASTEHLFTD
jgi:hypothetical protein